MTDSVDVSRPVVVENVKVKTKKPKHCYMLHKPESMESIGKFVSTDFRYAALKAASRGNEDIWLRATNTKEIHVYEGSVEKLSTPQVVTRGERTIEYTVKPKVHRVRKFLYTGDIDADADNAAEEEIQPKKKRARKAPPPAPATPAESSTETENTVV